MHLPNMDDPTDFDLSEVDKDALDSLELLTDDLCGDFTIYKQMFSAPEVREVAYGLSEDVMFILERALLFRVLMKFSALVGDISKEGKGWTEKRVLSLHELTAPLNSNLLNKKVAEVTFFYTNSGLKTWRNKLAAHNDKNILRSGNTPILDISTDEIHIQLQNVSDIINLLKGRSYVHTDVEVHFEFGVHKLFRILKGITP